MSRVSTFSPEMKQELPIWRRRERGEGEDRTEKNLLEGEVPFNYEMFSFNLIYV